MSPLGHFGVGLSPQALAEADRAWLQRLISRRVPLSDVSDALTRRPDDVKVVIDLQAAG